MSYISDAVGGWVGWILALPKFVSSVSPIPTRGGGADYVHHITACPPGFEILTASLYMTTKQFEKGENLQ